MNWVQQLRTRNLLVDSGCLVFESFYVFKDKLDFPIIYGFFNSLLSDIKQEKPETLAIFWGSRALEKKELYPPYQQNRTYHPEINWNELDEIKLILQDLGVCQLQYPGKEGDQLIAAVANMLNNCTILSEDKDFFQLLTGGKVLKGHRRGFWGPATVAEKFGLRRPELFTDYLTLIGDKVDNVPKILSEKVARELVNAKDSLEKWLLVDLPSFEMINNKVVVKLKEKIEQININYKLVNLKDERFDPKYFLLNPKPNLDRVMEKFEKMKMKRFMERFEEFEGLQKLLP